MRKTLLAAGLLVGGAMLGAGTQDRAQAEYDKLIAGKTAGKPQACLDTDRRATQLSAYGDKLVYRVSRKLVYVNQTTGGCEKVARGDALITRRIQTRACRGDIATTVDLPAGVQTGSCALGDFTPYRAN